jgi:hypothetical protein
LALNDYEVWALKQSDVRRLNTAEMTFMRHTARCSLLDHRRNEAILGEIKVDLLEISTV